MTLINWLLNKKMHVKISTKIYFFNMLNHALYFFYLCKYNIFSFERLGHMQTNKNIFLYFFE
jgi:hypothetical protein